MRRFILMLTSSVLVSGCTPSGASIEEYPQMPQTGGRAMPAYITLLGNYVGKQVRIEVDGQRVVDHRFTFPPPGAEDRLDIMVGPNGVVDVRVVIEGCPDVWEGQVRVAPLRSSGVIFDECAIQAVGPE